MQKLYEDDTFSELLEEDTKNSIKDVQEQLEDAMELLRGKHYSRMLLDMNGIDEMENIENFYNTIHTELDKTLQGKYYPIGDSAMSYEMSHRLDKELIFITLLTAVAIFLVVAISFRNFVLPFVLVLLVQCGVYITVTIIGFRGSGLYYLTLLMVEYIYRRAMCFPVDIVYSAWDSCNCGSVYCKKGRMCRKNRLSKKHKNK